MARKAQIPLSEVMGAIDTRNMDWYANLEPERKKAFSAWMMMRYASSVEGNMAASYMFYVNECVNKDFGALKGHDELQWRLMAACGRGRKVRHYYVKPPTSRKKKDRVIEFLLELFPHMKVEEVEMLRDMNNKEELKQFVRDHGVDDKTIKEVWK
jgi:hypothetical protein